MIALHFLERGKSAGKVEKRSRANAPLIVLVKAISPPFLIRELMWFFLRTDKSDFFFFYICKMTYSFFLDFV